MPLKVTHDVQPENEILINAHYWCDIGNHKVPEWMLQNTRTDVQMCTDCWNNFTE